MVSNLASADRAFRLLAAVACFGLAVLFLTGPLSVALIAVGVVFASTTVTGYCPLYALAGFSTRPRRRVLKPA